jgi:O-antigen ligase
MAAHPWQLLCGIGYKTLPYTQHLDAPVVADNMYLSLLVETGIGGLVALVWLNAAILRQALRSARSQDAARAFLGTWMFCFWAGEAVQMLSGDLLTYWRVLPVYFFVLAMAVRR